mmetsp:Transcript_7388/g.18446  ORF Transcript_7388/g.18446 Transcript_7388/m.18446 type:complete len:226 (-) Transcript_7388:381-1058(-)
MRSARVSAVATALLCLSVAPGATSYAFTAPAVLPGRGLALGLRSRPAAAAVSMKSESGDAMGNGENSLNVFKLMSALGPAGSSNIWSKYQDPLHLNDEDDGEKEIEPPSSEPISVPVNGDAVPIAKIRPKMGMIFTCNVCETRQTRQFSKLAYEKGIVIVKCKGCEKRHLIADNLGWYKDWLGAGNKNIEECLESRGEDVKRVAGKTAESVWSEWYEADTPNTGM